MKIFLLRHAQTLDNLSGINGARTNSPLTDEGKKQTKQLIPQLKKNKYDVIFVSPAHRTLETVQPYIDSLKKFKPEIISSNLIHERDLGELTGTPKGAINKYKEENNIKEDKIVWRPPKGESILDVTERAKEFLKLLKEKYSNKSVLICGHQNFLRCLELLLLKKSPYEFYSDNPPKLKNGELRKIL